MNLTRIVLLTPVLLLPAAALADDCNPVRPVDHPIATQAGDLSTATQFDAARPFSGHMLRLEGCYGELRLMRSEQANTVRVRIKTEKGAGGRELRDYVQELSTTGDGRIAVRLPKDVPGKVTIEVPAEIRLEVNWASGRVDVAPAIAGDKEINVGKGEARVYVGQEDYADIEANVGWGTISDQLPHAERHRMLRSITLSQTTGGKHNLEINVGSGHIDILKAE
jgi:hypothetical protein